MILSSITTMACVIIDSIITGRFLGTDAVAATGLVSPVIMLITLLCNLLGPGLGILCTRYIGMADKERVNQVFGIVTITAFILGLLASLVLFFTAGPLSSLLSAELKNPAITDMTSDYLTGFSFGIIFLSLSCCISQVMMVDNDMNRSLLSTVTTLIVDVILDLLNALVFHGGMIGMALATTISSVFGFLVIFLHFFKKDRILHFTCKGLKLTDLKEAIMLGLSGSISQLCGVIRGFVFNFILAASQAEAVAAFAVANSANYVILSVIISVLVTTDTLTSMFYGEEDRNSLYRVMDIAMKKTIKMTLILSLIYLIFTGPVTRIFLTKDALATSALATDFLRILTVQFMIMSLTFPVIGGFMGVGRSDLGNLAAVLREGIYPIVCVALLGMAFKIPGFEAGLVLTGVLSLFTTFLLPALSNKKSRAVPGIFWCFLKNSI
ncbi:MAG: hypothetical protein K6F00_10625 [Lachnospiraceae bacterium]|nr:hypothetical protein [Lachnospiraceae bacterium]